MGDVVKLPAGSTVTGESGAPAAPGPGDIEVVLPRGGPPAPPLVMDHLSWSQVSSFNDCAQKYYLGKFTQVPRQPKGYFIGGRTVHRVIEESENTGWWARPEAFLKDGPAETFFQDVFTDEMNTARKEGDTDKVEWGGRKSAAYPGGEDDRWWRASGPMMLRRYGALRRADHEAGEECQAVEARFTVSLPSGRSLVAYIDQVLTTRLRDWKTGQVGEPTDLGLQLGIYEWIRRELGLPPLKWGQYVFLRAKDQRQTYTIELEHWLPLIPLLLDQMQDRLERSLQAPDDPRSWPYAPGKHCGWCDVADYCEVGQRYAAVRGGHM